MMTKMHSTPLVTGIDKPVSGFILGTAAYGLVLPSEIKSLLDLSPRVGTVGEAGTVGTNGDGDLWEGVL